MTENRGIVYLLVGQSRAPELAVSLHTMRERGSWSGPVTILVGDDPAQHSAEWIVERFPGVGWQRIKDYSTRRNGAYCYKTRVGELSPYEYSVFIDADTIFYGNGSIEALWPWHPDEIVFTSFSDWTANGGTIIAGRIRQWKDYVPELVDQAFEKDVAGLNTGVFGLGRQAKMLPKWRELCEARPKFLCDETCANAIFHAFPHRLVDDRYNFSYRYGVNRPPVIGHGHGRGYIRKKIGRDIWMPIFRESLASVRGFADFAKLCDPAACDWLKRWENGE